MAQAIVIKGEVRKATGTGSARAARRADKVPAVVYGGKEKPLHINLPLKETLLVSSKRNFKSTLLEIELDGKKLLTLPRSVQFHPVTDAPEHLDLQFITDNLRIFIPVEFTNHAKSPGLKRGGVLNIVRREIEFFCNPAKIPEKIEVNLEGKEISQSIHIEDVTLPEGVKPFIKRNFTIATIAGRAAEEEVAAAPVAAQVVATAQKAPEAAAAAGGKDAKAPAKADAKKK